MDTLGSVPYCLPITRMLSPPKLRPFKPSVRSTERSSYERPRYARDGCWFGVLFHLQALDRKATETNSILPQRKRRTRVRAVGDAARNQRNGRLKPTPRLQKVVAVGKPEKGCNSPFSAFTLTRPPTPHPTRKNESYAILRAPLSPSATLPTMTTEKPPALTSQEYD